MCSNVTVKGWRGYAGVLLHRRLKTILPHLGTAEISGLDRQIFITVARMIKRGEPLVFHYAWRKDTEEKRVVLPLSLSDFVLGKG